MKWCGFNLIGIVEEVKFVVEEVLVDWLLELKVFVEFGIFND